jgi:hypothetical protein
VRDGSLGPPQNITPVDAAILIRRAVLIPVLQRYGAAVPERGPERTALICRAVKAEASEVVDLLLKMGDGSDPRGSCPPATAN